MISVLDKPSLLYVIGIPVGLLVVTCAIGCLVYLALARILHDE